MITLSVIITFYKDENFIEKSENRLLKKNNNIIEVPIA